MKTKYYYIFLVTLLFFACKKQDQWLDKKPNKSDIVPRTIADFNLLMNNTGVMNDRYGSYGTISSDNFYITYANWLGAYGNDERNAYVWAKDIYEGGSSFDWERSYNRIVFSNIVLDGLTKIALTSENQSQHNTLKGTALFFRGLNFYDLVQTFAKPYDKTTASDDLGIVLRLNSDVNEKAVRATLQQSYDQLLSDLLTSKELLPRTTQFKTQPSQLAVNSILARVYLSMSNYERAFYYADIALKEYDTLIDFNDLNPNAAAPFPTFQAGNKEVIFYMMASLWGIITYANLRVDDDLYTKYAADDLRKTLFYVNNGINGIAFKGNYTGSINGNFFCGSATNELYLIRAEASARLNNTNDALTDLNTLLRKRWNKNATYVPFYSDEAETVLAKIISERQKELPFFGALRWQDLRRLNKDPRFAKTLTRSLNGTIYTLPPNDPRYVYALPDIEIKLSGLPQNIR